MHAARANFSGNRYLPIDDQVFFEEIVENDDLMPIRYFEMGSLAAKPVGRIHLDLGPKLRERPVPSDDARLARRFVANEVRRMLGKPAKVQTYRAKGEEVWDWRFADGTTGVKMFSVTFDPAGAVRGTAIGSGRESSASKTRIFNPL